MGKVISVNTGEAAIIKINGKEYKTGIYKNPIEGAIHVGKNGVDKDTVVDTRVHGGIDKAVYLYPSEHYEYWKNFYPELEWQWGMFGENISTEGLIEMHAHIGSVYKIGEAIVQVSQPRQPCFKLGVRFGNPAIVKQFKESPFAGIYMRVLEEGKIKTGDSIELIEEKTDSVTILDVSSLLAKTIQNDEIMNTAIKEPFLAASAVKDLVKIQKANAK